MSRIALAKTRRNLGWTQTELARRSGEPVESVRDLENGRIRKPSHDLVMHVINAFRDGGLPNLQIEDIFPTSRRGERAEVASHAEASR